MINELLINESVECSRTCSSGYSPWKTGRKAYGQPFHGMPGKVPEHGGKGRKEASVSHCCPCGTVSKLLTFRESSRERRAQCVSWVCQGAGGLRQARYQFRQEVVTLGLGEGLVSLSHTLLQEVLLLSHRDKYLLYSSSWRSCSSSPLPLWKTPAKHRCLSLGCFLDRSLQLLPYLPLGV